MNRHNSGFSSGNYGNGTPTRANLNGIVGNNKNQSGKTGSSANRNAALFGLKSEATLDMGMPTTATTAASSDTNMLFGRPSATSNNQGSKAPTRTQSNAPAPPSASGQPDRIQALNRANNGGRPTMQPGHSNPRALTGTRASMPSNRTTTYTTGLTSDG